MPGSSRTSASDTRGRDTMSDPRTPHSPWPPTDGPYHRPTVSSPALATAQPDVAQLETTLLSPVPAPSSPPSPSGGRPPAASVPPPPTPPPTPTRTPRPAPVDRGALQPAQPRAPRPSIYQPQH